MKTPPTSIMQRLQRVASHLLGVIQRASDPSTVADADLLAKAGSAIDIVKARTIAQLMLLAAAISGAGMAWKVGVTLMDGIGFAPALAVAVAAGGVWSAFLLRLERMIVLTVPPDLSRQGAAVFVATRLVLALLLGAVQATPFVLQALSGASTLEAERLMATQAEMLLRTNAGRFGLASHTTAEENLASNLAAAKAAVGTKNASALAADAVASQCVDALDTKIRPPAQRSINSLAREANELSTLMANSTLGSMGFDRLIQQRAAVLAQLQVARRQLADATNRCEGLAQAAIEQANEVALQQDRAVTEADQALAEQRRRLGGVMDQIDKEATRVQARVEYAGRQGGSLLYATLSLLKSDASSQLLAAIIVALFVLIDSAAVLSKVLGTTHSPYEMARAAAIAQARAQAAIQIAEADARRDGVVAFEQETGGDAAARGAQLTQDLDLLAQAENRDLQLLAHRLRAIGRLANEHERTQDAVRGRPAFEAMVDATLAVARPAAA